MAVRAMVAADLYGLACPVAVADRRKWAASASAARLGVQAGPDGAAISAAL
jgi:hypothetical protein